VHRLAGDDTLRDQLLAESQLRLDHFSLATSQQTLLHLLDPLLGDI